MATTADDTLSQQRQELESHIRRIYNSQNKSDKQLLKKYFQSQYQGHLNGNIGWTQKDEENTRNQPYFRLLYTGLLYTGVRNIHKKPVLSYNKWKELSKNPKAYDNEIKKNKDNFVLLTQQTQIFIIDSMLHELQIRKEQNIARYDDDDTHPFLIRLTEERLKNFVQIITDTTVNEERLSILYNMLINQRFHYAVESIQDELMSLRTKLYSIHTHNNGSDTNSPAGDSWGEELSQESPSRLTIQDPDDDWEKGDMAQAVAVEEEAKLLSSQTKAKIEALKTEKKKADLLLDTIARDIGPITSESKKSKKSKKSGFVNRRKSSGQRKNSARRKSLRQRKNSAQRKSSGQRKNIMFRN